eukprot:753950-Pelagomonas_calceolata.AAC.3
MLLTRLTSLGVALRRATSTCARDTSSSHCMLEPWPKNHTHASRLHMPLQVVERDLHDGFIVATSYKGNHNHLPLAAGVRVQNTTTSRRAGSPRAAKPARGGPARAPATSRPSRAAAQGSGSTRKVSRPQVRVGKRVKVKVTEAEGLQTKRLTASPSVKAIGCAEALREGVEDMVKGICRLLAVCDTQ